MQRIGRGAARRAAWRQRRERRGRGVAKKRRTKIGGVNGMGMA